MSKTDETTDTIDSWIEHRRAAAGKVAASQTPSKSVRWFVVGIALVSAALAIWYAFA